MAALAIGDLGDERESARKGARGVVASDATSTGKGLKAKGTALAMDLASSVVFFQISHCLLSHNTSCTSCHYRIRMAYFSYHHGDKCKFCGLPKKNHVCKMSFSFPKLYAKCAIFKVHTVHTKKIICCFAEDATKCAFTLNVYRLRKQFTCAPSAKK